MKEYLIGFIAGLLVAIGLGFAYHNFWYVKVYNTGYDMGWRFRGKAIQKDLKDCLNEENLVRCLYIAEIGE